MPVKSKKNNKPGISIAIIILVLLLDLFFLYYLKYDNQKLSLTEFNFYNIGNFLNLFFTGIIIIGIVFYSFQKKNKPRITLLISFTVILNIILILAAVSIKAKLPVSKGYLFAHPFSEVLTGALFMLYQFAQFVFISVLWLNLLGGKELLIVRAGVNSLILVVLLFLFAFLYLSTRKDIGKVNPVKNSRNIAVVLGAAVWSKNIPSPSLAARTEKAAELLRDGYVGNIQLTGSNAPGELSEAEVAFNYIKKQDIDTTRISIEKSSTSTNEQIQYVKNHFLNNDTINSVIIVSDSYHLPRIQEICKFFNVKADVAASDLSLSFDNKIYYKLRESLALIVFWFFAL